MSKGRISERLRKKLNEGTMTVDSLPVEQVKPMADPTSPASPLTEGETK